MIFRRYNIGIAAFNLDPEGGAWNSDFEQRVGEWVCVTPPDTWLFRNGIWLAKSLMIFAVVIIVVGCLYALDYCVSSGYEDQEGVAPPPDD